MVAEFATQITEFLTQLGVEAVVVACNTASAAALPRLCTEFSVPIWGVIEPGVEAARKKTRSGRVGVIGTKGTIASGAYQRRLEACGLTVWAQACPMLVHVVEEGLAESPEAEILARHYLDGRPELDTLILGCTHYPLLSGVLQRVAGEGVSLVDSAEATADVVCASLEPMPAGTQPGRFLHFVTGDPLAFEHTAQVIGEVEGRIVPLAVTELAELEAKR
jgi:glutamate racemase